MTPPRLSLSSAGWVIGVTHHDTPNQDRGMAVPAGVSGVVMHTMVGNLPGTDGWFMNPASQASAHFGIAQDGTVIQWVNVRGGVAWHCANGNSNWYGIEHADNGNPANPLTPAQIDASAQLVELLSRDDVGRFPLQEANSTSQLGYGVHYMGGAAWGGHSCPGPGPRAGQRPAILALAQQIRSGTIPAPVGPSNQALQEDSMLVTFGTDGRAGIPVPKYATHIRLACPQGATVGWSWPGTKSNGTATLTSTAPRADVALPADQTGLVVLNRTAGAEPVYCVWIIN